MAIASTKKKKLTDDVYHIIRNDIPLRQKIGKALAIDPQSVWTSACRKSPRLSLPFILEIISKHIGKTKEEILEPNT